VHEHVYAHEHERMGKARFCGIAGVNGIRVVQRGIALFLGLW